MPVEAGLATTANRAILVAKPASTGTGPDGELIGPAPSLVSKPASTGAGPDGEYVFARSVGCSRLQPKENVELNGRINDMRLTGFLFLTCVFCLGCGTATSSHPQATKTPRAVHTKVERGPVAVTVKVVPAPARLSDEPQLTLTIEYEPGVEIQKPPFGEAVGDFIVRGFREPLPRSDGKRLAMEQIYTLEPTQAGPSQIDPIVVSFRDKRTNGDGQVHRVETEALTIDVLSALGESSPSLANLKGPQGPVPLPSTTPYLMWWLVAAVAAAIAIGAWLSFRRPTPQRIPSPREIAEQELADLWKSNTARDEVKSFYVELTGIVRRFTERTTGIHAPEQTTAEFLREIVAQGVFPRDEQQRLRDFLEAADLVKFAAHQPLFQDIEESYKRASRFVSSTAAEQPA